MKKLNPLSVTLPYSHSAITGLPLLSLGVFFMENEIWKDVPDYEGLYIASNLGRIKSIAYRTNHVLKPGINSQGYACVILTKNTIRTSLKAHRIICLTFIDNPENKETVNHKDGIRDNNNVCNLEWATSSENIRHSFRCLDRNPSMRGNFGRLHHASIPVDQLSKSGVILKQWESLRHIERELGYPHHHISNVCKGKRISAYGYVWKFASKF